MALVSEAMRAAVDSMTERQRDVFFALADGHTYSTAAEAFGMDRMNARKCHLAARAKVADHLLPLLYDLIREEGAA